MRLDEMIITANANNKTYFCNGTDLGYSRENGFTKTDGTSLLQSISLDFCPSVCVVGWNEKSKRRLTVAQAEKELDCVIDVPDISKLFRPMSEKPNDKRNVIIASNHNELDLNYCGYYDSGNNLWRWFGGFNAKIMGLCSCYWIDPEDLIKLLPKE